VKSLAIDWLTGQLYWASITQKAIYTGAADGSALGIVMSKEMDPSDMVLSPIERYKLLLTLVQLDALTHCELFTDYTSGCGDEE